MESRGNYQRKVTLGSLFDGAGGFPLAGTMAGITPVWASEIEPFPIRVTTRRFPEMKHLGNITEVDGGTIDPVDIITFGSPCQDLSVANGARKGLQGERSGLFLEAIRIIKEMREKTNGRKPQWICWENVPGAFSSNGGDDFRTVLEEIAKIKDPGVCVPRPEWGGWPRSGELVGSGYSIAWRTVDAKFWGVPQRRKRIYLVADFGGNRAGKVQFECDRLFGDSETGAGQGQAAPETAGRCPAEASGAFCLNDQGGERIDVTEGYSGTLRSQTHGHPPVIAAAGTMTFHLTQDPIVSVDSTPCLTQGNPENGQATIGVLVPVAYGLVSKASNAWKSSNPHSGCYQTDTARTLDTSGGDATRNQGGNLILTPAAVFENHGQDTRFRPTGDTAQTVVAKYGTGGGNQPLVVQPFAIGRDYKTVETEATGTLTRSDVPGMVAQPYVIGNGQVNGLTLGTESRALDCMHDAQAVIIPTNLDYIVRRLMPLECSRLQGYPDWWMDGLETPEPTEDEIDWWADVFETHRKAVKPDIKPRTRNQIRKWLQDPRNDSAEYRMWGNSLAIPNAYHVLAGIAEEIRKGPSRTAESDKAAYTRWTAGKTKPEYEQLTFF